MQNYYRCNNKTYAKQKQRKTKQVIKHKIGNAKITEETRENAIGKQKTNQNSVNKSIKIDKTKFLQLER